MDYRKNKFWVIARIVYAAVFLFALASCEQSVTPIPAPVVPVITIITHPVENTTVTQGRISGSLSVEATVTEGAALGYQWYSAQSASNTGGTKIDNATSASYIIPSTLTARTYYYYCVITAPGADTKRSNVATVKVNPVGTPPVPVITINSHPAEKTTVTQGNISGSLNVGASVTEGATLTYQWYSNTNASITGGTKIDNEVSPTYTLLTGLLEGTYYYYCEVKAEGADTVVSTVATVKVNALGMPPVPVITIVIHPVDRTVTEGSISGSLTVAASVTQGVAPAYQWYRNTNKSNSGGTVVPNAREMSFTIPTTLTVGTYYYYCVITAPGADTKRSTVATVEINPPDMPSVPVITINSQPTPSTTITAGSITSSLSVTASITEGAVLSYQWYYSATNSNTGGEIIPNARSASFPIPSVLPAGIYYFYCEVTAAGADTKRSNVAIVKVNPSGTPSVSVIYITTQPAASIIVAEGSISGSLSVTANVTGNVALTYQWYSASNQTNSGGTVVSNGTSAAFTIPTTLKAGTYYYYCEVSAAGVDTKPSTVATVTVNSPPPSSPVELTFDTWKDGNISTPGGEQWFTFKATGTGQSIFVSLGTLTNLYVQLYDKAMNVVGDRENFSAPSGSSSILFFGLINPGETYYIKVTPYSSDMSGIYGIFTGSSSSSDTEITITKQPAETTTVTRGSITGSLSVEASATKGATPHYQWYKNEYGSNSWGEPVNDVSTNGTFTIPTDLIDGTHYFYCEVTAAGTFPVSSAVATVIVGLTPPSSPVELTFDTWKDGIIPASGVKEQWFSFKAAAATYIHMECGGLGLNVRVYDSAMEVGDRYWTDVTGDYSLVTELNPGETYYIRVTPYSGDTSGSYRIKFNTSAWTNPSYITITTQPAPNTTVTAGSGISKSLSVQPTVTDNSEPFYSWYMNSTNSIEGGTPIYGGDDLGGFYIPTDLPAGTYYFYCKVSANHLAEDVYSNVATVTMIAPSSPVELTFDEWKEGNIPSSEAKEQWFTFTTTETTQNIHVRYGTLQSLDVQLYDSAMNTVGDMAHISSYLGGSFSRPVKKGEKYYIKVWSYYGNDSGNYWILFNTSSTLPSSIITITKQPAASTTVREGSITGSLSVAASVTNNRGLDYNWYKNTTNSIEGSTGAGVSWGNDPGGVDIPTDLAPGTYYFYCVVTAQAVLDDEPDPVYSNFAKVTVNPLELSIDTQPAPTTTVREGEITGSLSVSASVTNGTMPYYQWYQNTTNSTEGAWPISNGSTCAIPTNLWAGTYYFYCEVTAMGAATVYSVYSNIVKVTVDPPAAVIRIQGQPEPATSVTVGRITGSLQVLAYVTDGSTPYYQWYKNTTNSTEGATAIYNATSASYTIPTDLTVGTYYYFCEVTATEAVTVYSNVAKVTVIDTGDMEIIIQLYSEDDPALIEQFTTAAPGTDKIFTASAGYTDYKWYVDGDLAQEGTEAKYIFNKPAETYELLVVVTNSAGEKYSGSCHVTVR